jgi:hypothetical protein
MPSPKILNRPLELDLVNLVVLVSVKSSKSSKPVSQTQVNVDNLEPQTIVRASDRTSGLSTIARETPWASKN